MSSFKMVVELFDGKKGVANFQSVENRSKKEISGTVMGICPRKSDDSSSIIRYAVKTNSGNYVVNSKFELTGEVTLKKVKGRKLSFYNAQQILEEIEL